MLEEVSAKKYAKKRGKAESKIEVAKKLIKLGTDIAIVENVTGLTKQKIKSLIKEEKYTKSF